MRPASPTPPPVGRRKKKKKMPRVEGPPSKVATVPRCRGKGLSCLLGFLARAPGGGFPADPGKEPTWEEGAGSAWWGARAA